MWGGRIVSESTLSSRITLARQAIGDTGEAQRLIRTVPRKGLRFVGEVQEKLPSQEVGAETVLAPPDETRAPAAAPSASPERRQLTIMVCNMVGSAALAARLDPEDLREVVATYHRCVREVVERRGGFVAKFTADGALVYFGYPQAHEDDAERAVRAGLVATKAVGELKVDRFTEGLETRVAIATGLVVVDNASNGSATEPAALGEAPLLAGNLITLADPGAVVISVGTRRLLGSLFDYRELAAGGAKGSAQPIEVYQVLRESAVASRLEALRSPRSELVGREEELEFLIRRWERVKRGEGRVVLITGEAGIGKSRLARAFQERLSSERHTPLTYHCSPHHRDAALYPFIRQLLRAAGIEHDDSSETKLCRLRSPARAIERESQRRPAFVR